MASTKEKTSAAKLYTIQEDDLPTKKTEANISSNVFTNETSRKQACNMRRFIFDCMMYLITLMLMPTWLLACASPSLDSETPLRRTRTRVAFAVRPSAHSANLTRSGGMRSSATAAAGM